MISLIVDDLIGEPYLHLSSTTVVPCIVRDQFDDCITDGYPSIAIITL